MPTEISTDIEGIIRELEIEDYLYPLYELVVNSFQAIAERFEDESREKGKVDVKIVRRNSTQEGIMNPIERIIVADNGRGFAKANYKSFSTAYSSHKAKLGGKGIGRFAALAVFNEFSVESVYEEDGIRMKRVFSLTRASHGKIEEIFHDKCEDEIGTKVKLSSISDAFQDDSAIGERGYIAEKVFQHVLLYYLNGNAPHVSIDDNGESVDLDSYIDGLNFKEFYHSEKISGREFFVYALPKDKQKVHKVLYCANNRVVATKRLTTILPLFDAPVIREEKESYLNFYVVSDYLDEISNLGRTGFKFPKKKDKEVPQRKLLSAEIFEQDIDDGIVKSISSMFASEMLHLQDNRRKRVEEFISSDTGLEYRNVVIDDLMLNQFGANVNTKEIRDALNEKKYKMSLAVQEKKDKLFERDYSNKDDYQNLMKEVVGLVDEENSARLAQYVSHRKVIIRLFEKYLQWIDINTQTYENESALHNLIYTMGGTQKTISYDKHNLWLLDDRLAYYRYITSDKSIRLHEALKGNAGSNKEPDITLYDVPFYYAEKDLAEDIKSIVIFEIKRPDVDVTYLKYLEQSNNQINGIRDGLLKDDHGGSIPRQPNTPIFHYFVCDEKAYNTLKDELIKNNMGFVLTPYNSVCSSNNATYREVFSYRTMLINAKRRNYAFFKRLGIN